MYAVKKDVWHLKGLDKTIVEQLLRWSNNLFNFGTYESRQQYFKNQSAVKYPDLYEITKTNENYGCYTLKLPNNLLNLSRNLWLLSEP
ncbi:MAG: hypothetical protein WBL95_07570 [Microcoleus sp.]